MEKRSIRLLWGTAWRSRSGPASSRSWPAGRVWIELYTIVDLGGAVLNLSVEHGFYGYVKMDVNVRSHDEADRYLKYFRSTCRSVMDGFQDDGHQYLIETHSKEALARIRSALDALATA